MRWIFNSGILSKQKDNFESHTHIDMLVLVYSVFSRFVTVWVDVCDYVYINLLMYSVGTLDAIVTMLTKLYKFKRF